MDANLLIRFVGKTPASGIRNLWREWIDARVTLHAPALLRCEVVNGIHRLRRSGQVDSQEASRALVKALDVPIVFHDDQHLHIQAFHLAAEYGLPAAYDAQYLALAQRLAVEFWTTDAKLFKAVEDRLAWVRLVS